MRGSDNFDAQKMKTLGTNTTEKVHNFSKMYLNGKYIT